MQGRIDGLNSQLKKLKKEMNSTIFNQKPVTDTGNMFYKSILE